MSKNVVPVLADEYFRPVELVDFYVSNLLDRKKTAEAIKLLTISHPLGKFQHLKRVRNTGGANSALQILLCPAKTAQGRLVTKISVPAEPGTDRAQVYATNQEASDSNGKVVAEQIVMCLKTDSNLGNHKVKNSDTVSDHSTDVSSVLQCGVPEGVFGKPYLVKVPLHAPLTRKQYEETILYWPSTFHEDKRITRLLTGKFFTEADVTHIQSYLQQAQVMADLALHKGQGTNGIVIIDPVKNTVIAKGHSLTQDSPLMHAALVGTDLVARSQGGGMWDISDKDMFFHQNEDTVTNAVLPETTQNISNKEKTGPYLCSGFHAYMFEEPCPMCSMALLHSRISRVFYIKPQADGALGSRYKLHTIPSLNHHFEVFQWTGELHSNS